ncbi:hypothetical protein O1L55_12645 [Streptomyces albulus]|nr:hypothetical protein [Streptomyces noursei]
MGALLAADSRAVYLLTTDGRLRCVGTDGKVRWTQRPPLSLAGGTPSAALGAGHLRCARRPSDVAAVRAGDGARAWSARARPMSAPARRRRRHRLPRRPEPGGGGGRRRSPTVVPGPVATAPARHRRLSPPAVTGGVVHALTATHCARCTPTAARPPTR